jgi:hypothetical protein
MNRAIAREPYQHPAFSRNEQAFSLILQNFIHSNESTLTLLIKKNRKKFIEPIIREIVDAENYEVEYEVTHTRVILKKKAEVRLKC